ncbi:MAG: hypothetical protein WBI74_02775 [Caldicoprobacterales bacterium]|mgnify:CR=1 FL=1|nr:hypothetical protein [Methanosarcina thermophila]HPT81284.1 hypothetical protein [Methanosarcina thermophila]
MKTKINLNENSSKNKNKLKLVNNFKTLTEQEENLISSSLLDFLLFLNSHLEMFKYYITMLYKKFNKDTIYQYYLDHVIKSGQISKLLENFQVLVDIREYINYYYAERKNEYGNSLNNMLSLQMALFSDKDTKIKHYFEKYDFVDEVKAIIKYCRYHYQSIEEIPSEYKVKIIKKIETILYLKDAPNVILEMLS